MVAKVKRERQQRGGFGLGVVVGLLVGLALALAVALYVTKAPVPFVEKVPGRTQEQDAAEVERNRNWDPNSPLYGKNPAKPQAVESTPPVASGVVQPVVPAVEAPPPANEPAATEAQPPVPGEPASTSAANKPAAAKPVAAAASVDPSARYLVQIGAYTSAEDAEQQRAKLAMNGFTARISERERDGKIFYRVRLGSFSADEAESVKKKMAAVGYGEAALIRVTGK